MAKNQTELKRGGKNTGKKSLKKGEREIKKAQRGKKKESVTTEEGSTTLIQV